MSKKERKLSPAEQQRKLKFEQVCDEMEQNGYQKKDLTVSVLLANFAAFILMLPFVVVTWVIYPIFNSVDTSALSPNATISLLVAFILLTVLHEAVHGLTWGFFAKSHFKAIKFGVIWKAITPYCTCDEPLNKLQYIIGAFMPTLILGFGLSAVATVFGSLWFLFLSSLMIMGGGGDFFIIVRMLFYNPKGKDVLYYDHPYKVGLVVFEREIATSPSYP